MNRPQAPLPDRSNALWSDPCPADHVAFSLADLEYELPSELIAQAPAVERDQARLLVVHPGASSPTDGRVCDLPDFLRPGDLLVFNDTRVVPARLRLRRRTGGRIEGLFLAERRRGVWVVMLRGAARCRRGETLSLLDRRDVPVRMVTLRERTSEGYWLMELEPATSNQNAGAAMPDSDDANTILSNVGLPPLPPYIRRENYGYSATTQDATRRTDQSPHDQTAVDDFDRYQTIYARRPGAVAAPTAGLHFTPGLLERLTAAGIEHAFVTLHVGLGTFKPITAGRIEDHVMHEEWFELPATTVEAVFRCRRRGGRVVAVGTTTVRVLESCAGPDGSLRASPGTTRLFIYPPYRFRAVDLLLTNFHLPGSTLLALVMAFGGVNRIRRAYAHAIRSKYRFYSYGDAMLVFPEREG